MIIELNPKTAISIYQYWICDQQKSESQESYEMVAKVTTPL